mmetsp:Transcript_67671/g.102001  ORF Transcript_67671/g.102001 Transcript_67671/m.102001 type:complete len:296 (-) Transcript_67671:1481-2368(-)
MITFIENLRLSSYSRVSLLIEYKSKYSRHFFSVGKENSFIFSKFSITSKNSVKRKNNFYLNFSAMDSSFGNKQDNEVDLTGDGGVVKNIKKKGEGVETKEGSFVKVHYKGRLENGDTFDSSFERNEPYSFKIGEGKVIKGWEIGVKSMKVGEKANFTVAPNYGYKKKGIPPIIPPNAKLFFEIELLDSSQEQQNPEGFYNEKVSAAPRTPKEISQDFEKRMQEKTKKPGSFGNFFFISPFRSQTGEKAPWWLNPNITFALAAVILLLVFSTVVSIGGIHQGYVDQDFDANLLKKF